MHEQPWEPGEQITDGVDTPTGQVWEETVRGTPIPDLGWTQRYDVAKELGDCYATVGDHEAAGRCYDRAAVLGPDEPGPYVGMGVIALQEGRLEDAETAFRVACRLDGRCSEALCGLAMVAEAREDGEGAFELYLRSLECNVDNLTALLGLFQVSCRMGSFEKVIHYLELYLEMHPGDVSVMFCLAALYRRQGRVGPARRLLQDVLALEPGHEDAAQLLEEIEHRATPAVG